MDTVSEFRHGGVCVCKHVDEHVLELADDDELIASHTCLIGTFSTVLSKQ